MNFAEYTKRVHEIESSNRTQSAKQADIRQLQGQWQNAVKNNKVPIKRNDMSHIREKVDRRIEMRQEELANKWGQ